MPGGGATSIGLVLHEARNVCTSVSTHPELVGEAWQVVTATNGESAAQTLTGVEEEAAFAIVIVELVAQLPAFNSRGGDQAAISGEANDIEAVLSWKWRCARHFEGYAQPARITFRNQVPIPFGWVREQH